METVILDGGPSDGKRIAISDGTRTVTAATAEPVLVVTGEPRPPWWRFIRRLRWRPPPMPVPPKVIQLSYRDSGERLGGLRVFRVDGWQSYRGPEISGDGSLYKSLVTALYAVHPALRLGSSGTRWVMDLSWYRRVRAEAMRTRTDPDGNDPAKWLPDPADLLIGIPVSVTEGGGRPHLENKRYPAGWPNG